jgi:hypothetical protein
MTIEKENPQTTATLQLVPEFLRALSGIEHTTIQLENLNTNFKLACGCTNTDSVTTESSTLSLISNSLTVTETRNVSSCKIQCPSY